MRREIRFTLNGDAVSAQVAPHETLVEVLQKAGEPMKVSDIADAVQSTGYRSNSANFRGIVNQLLIKDKRFTSPSRSLYQMKK